MDITTKEELDKRHNEIFEMFKTDREAYVVFFLKMELVRQYSEKLNGFGDVFGVYEQLCGQIFFEEDRNTEIV